MNPFNLTRLNRLSPYSVWIDTRGLNFKTDYEIYYTVEFDMEDSAFGVTAYWFNLTNNTLQNSPNDEKVQKTIVCIIEEFFRTNPDILLYMCDTADNQQAVRARLFLHWFNKYGKSEDYVIKTAVVHSSEETNYVALILQRCHPSFFEIMQLFEQEIEIFQNNKP